MSLERFVATTSTKAAKAFGLYPRKGVIQAGAEADVRVIGPEKPSTVRAEDDPSNADYTLYEGWEITGWPVIVIRRGEVVYHDGQLVGWPGSGRLAERTARSL